MSPDASLFDDITPPAGGILDDGPDWAGVRASLDSEGIALTPPLLTEAECEEVRGWFGDPERFRSTVVMQRYGFGRGTYRYLADPLPGLVRELREQLYRPLAQEAEYEVRGVIESAEHRRSRRIGPFDRITCRFDLYEAGELAATVTNVFAVPRPGQDGVS